MINNYKFILLILIIKFFNRILCWRLDIVRYERVYVAYSFNNMNTNEKIAAWTTNAKRYFYIDFPCFKNHCVCRINDYDSVSVADYGDNEYEYSWVKLEPKIKGKIRCRNYRIKEEGELSLDSRGKINVVSRNGYTCGIWNKSEYDINEKRAGFFYVNNKPGVSFIDSKEDLLYQFNKNKKKINFIDMSLGMMCDMDKVKEISF